MKERLFEAYFRDGLVVSDPETLVSLAAELGLDAQFALASDAHADDVRRDSARARGLGISSVPYFVFDARYGVPGAQAADVLLGVMRDVITANQGPPRAQ